MQTDYERQASEILVGEPDFHLRFDFVRDDLIFTHPTTGNATTFHMVVGELQAAASSPHAEL